MVHSSWTPMNTLTRYCPTCVLRTHSLLPGVIACDSSVTVLVFTKSVIYHPTSRSLFNPFKRSRDGWCYEFICDSRSSPELLKSSNDFLCHLSDSVKHKVLTAFQIFMSRRCAATLGVLGNLTGWSKHVCSITGRGAHQVSIFLEWT